MNSNANDRLPEFINERIAEFDDIPSARRETLAELAKFVRTQREAGRPIRVTFICTHNSRRSQMAQVWASIAAAHYDIKGFEAFSGGTERTAFNPRAVAALKRAGVSIEARPTVVDGDNVKYAVAVPRREKPQECFSKVYNEAPNPSADFAAVMTCSEADRNCPSVTGAAARIALPYDDPKLSDGTAREAQAYDQRCRHIAREMLYVFSLL
jgi:arsenate reductase (thioredoxin)